MRDRNAPRYERTGYIPRGDYRDNPVAPLAAGMRTRNNPSVVIGELVNIPVLDTTATIKDKLPGGLFGKTRYVVVTAEGKKEIVPGSAIRTLNPSRRRRNPAYPGVTSAGGIGNLVTGSVKSGTTNNPRKLQGKRFLHLSCPSCAHRLTIQPEALEVVCPECGAKSRVNR